MDGCKSAAQNLLKDELICLECKNGFVPTESCSNDLCHYGPDG